MLLYFKQWSHGHTGLMSTPVEMGEMCPVLSTLLGKWILVFKIQTLFTFYNVWFDYFNGQYPYQRLISILQNKNYDKPHH